MADDVWTAGAASEPDLKDLARTAWTLGLVAVGLAMVAPCTSYLTAFGALPLGLMALARARRVTEAGGGDEATGVYARTAQITGLIAAVWSGLLLLFLGSIVLLYAGMFAMVFAGQL